MLQAYKKFWRGYGSFRERTTRKDFWLATFVQIIFLIFFYAGYQIFAHIGHPVLPNVLTALSYFFLFLLWIYFLVTLIPFISMTVRRLRDAGLAYGLIFLNFIPILGSFALLVLNLLPHSKDTVEITEFTAPKRKNVVLDDKGKIGILRALKYYFRGYFSFSGRTSRRSFWWTQLVFAIFGILFIIFFVMNKALDQLIFGQIFVGTEVMEFILVIYVIGLFFPQLTVHIRRLRDAGLTNFAIATLLGGIGAIVIFKVILWKIIDLSYGVNHYDLINYLLFLLIMILIVALFSVEMMKSDELATEEKTLIFRKMD
ncbi:MAG: DUF805 domain-containing protein [Streptococcaceae bacterium]|nr:DUF805 domain-containing protein [Streptococcaceae bacterium]